MIETFFIFAFCIALSFLMFHIDSIKNKLEDKISNEIGKHHNMLQAEIVSLIDRVKILEAKNIN